MNLIISGIFQAALDVFSVTWWIIVPLGLFFVWQEFWLWGLNYLWKRKIKWAFLEIKIPGTVEKTPKAMEGVFSTLHGIYSKDMGWEDRYFKGEDLLWFTFELVGYAGDVHFYIRCPRGHRNLVESAIYSEYPDAEINEVEDYTELMPEVLPNDIYDIWGQDFVLSKPSPYPIKSYEFFEANVEEQRLDPIAAITEVMSRLKEGEAIWLQYIIRPVPDSWKKEGEEVRDKLMQRKAVKSPDLVESSIKFLTNLVEAPVQPPIWEAKSKEEDKVSWAMMRLSPGEQDVLKGIENKMSKLGFEVDIRFVYIDRKDSFSPANVAAVNGAFRQFNTQDMNGFRPLKDTLTYITSRMFTYKSWFRKRRILYRKRFIYDMYKLRWFPSKHYILNTEELATVFHFPSIVVKAPMLRRVETRKGEPPAGLPIMD